MEAMDNEEDRIKVGMRVSFESVEPSPDVDPRIPGKDRKSVSVIKYGTVHKIAGGQAVVQLDDGTFTTPILLDCLTPLP
jgi:hypothetical protein